MNELELFGGTPANQLVLSGKTVFIEFDGGRVAVVEGDEPQPILNLACRDLRLDWKSQYTKIKADPAICMVETTTQLPGDDQSRTVMTTDLDGFGLWLAKINANKVSPEARDLVITWQRKAARAIRERFFGKPTGGTEMVIPRNYAAALRAAADLADELDEAKLQLAGETQRADVEHERAEQERARNSDYENADAVTITVFRKERFTHVPEDDFWDVMYDEKRAGLLINQRLTVHARDRAGNLRYTADGEPELCDGWQHRHPTAKGLRYLQLVKGGVYGGKTRYSTKIKPGKDSELELRDYLARWLGHPGQTQIGAQR